MPIRKSVTIKRAEFERRWLEKTICAAPCWEGITPGLTTVDDAVQLLKANPGIAMVKVTRDQGIDFNYVEWESASGGGSASFDPDTNIIWGIHPGYMVPFQLKDIIAAYGEPTHIYAWITFGEHEPNGPFYSIFDVFYMNHGIHLSTTADPDKNGIHGERWLYGLTFFNPTDDGIARAFRTNVVAHYPQVLVPWAGFQDFEYYCRTGERDPQPC